MRDTSREAETSVASLTAKMRARVNAHLISTGATGATDEEIATALGMNPNTERPRRQELEVAGLCFDSGERRRLCSGRKGIVWVASRIFVTGRAVFKKKTSAGEVRALKRVLLMAAASHQGGHSEVGAAIAAVLEIPFPVTMEALEKAATDEGFEPAELWPWLYKMRAGRTG